MTPDIIDQLAEAIARHTARRIPLAVAPSQSVLGVKSASLDALFRKAKARAGIADWHFHDSRAEAITGSLRKTWIRG